MYKVYTQFFFVGAKDPTNFASVLSLVSLIATHPVCVGVGVFLIIQLFLFLLGRLGVYVCLELFQTFSCHLFYLIGDGSFTSSRTLCT